MRPPRTCPHGRTKWRCKDCGSGYCEHNKQKGQCRACGTGYCPHNSRKDRCPECGTARCDHGKLRSRCADCMPLQKLQRLSTQCTSCGVTQVCRLRSVARGGNGLCSQCDTVKPRINTERALAADLMGLGIPAPSAVDNTMTGGPSCQVGRRRPDIVWVGTTHVVNLEIDEDSHAARASSCEVSKAQETRFGAEAGAKPLIMIRYNPDQYDGVDEEYDDRAARLLYLAEVLRFCIGHVDASGLAAMQPNLVFLFYHSRSKKHIVAAQEAEFPTVVLPAGAATDIATLPAGLRALRALLT